MKAILMSIRPQHLINILKGDKTIELRKRFPKDFRGWVYLYCTKAIKGKPTLIRSAFSHSYRLDTWYVDDFEINLSGKVVARVWVDNVEDIIVINHDTQTRTLSEFDLSVKSCVAKHELNIDFEDSKAIHISKLEIFDKPKPIYRYKPLTKAPQSWQYIYIEEVI